MHFGTVIVRSVEELDRYHSRLTEARKELEEAMDTLATDCRDQNNNWDDPQYRAFEKKLDEAIQAFRSLLKEDFQKAIDDVDEVLKHLK